MKNNLTKVISIAALLLGPVLMAMAQPGPAIPSPIPPPDFGPGGPVLCEPTIPTITGSVLICDLPSAGNVYITETGMTGYIWTISAGGLITAGAGTNSVTVTWTVIGSQTIGVNYISLNGCTSASPTMKNVAVYQFPDPTITGPALVCIPNTGVAYSTEPGMTGYHWWVSTLGTITAGAGTNVITVLWNGYGDKVVSVGYTHPGGCMADSTIKNVYVAPSPPATRTLTNRTIVNGDSYCYDATQTITLAGGGTFFLVKTGGSVTLIAGQNILLLPGSTVEPGGNLHAFISSECSGYCNLFKDAVSVASVLQDSSGKPDPGPILNDKPGQFFKIYPNPTNATFTLELSEFRESSPVKVEIYGMLGEKLLNDQFTGPKHEFTLTDQKPGIYLLKVVQDGETGVRKIIRQ